MAAFSNKRHPVGLKDLQKSSADEEKSNIAKNRAKLNASALEPIFHCMHLQKRPWLQSTMTFCV